MKTDLNLHRVLADLSNSHGTGCLEVYYNNIYWRVSLQSGQLLGVDCSVHSWNQLNHWLLRHGCERAAQIVASKQEQLSGKDRFRQEIERLVNQGILDSMKASQIALEVTKESLESLLWLKEGACQWYDTSTHPSLTAKISESRLNLPKVIEYYQQRLQIWQRYVTVVKSPHQRPYFIHHRFSEESVSVGTLNPAALNQIAQLMRGRSLRELALFLKQDELKVIQLLIPYIRANIICLREPPEPLHNLPPIPEPEISSIALEKPSSSPEKRLVRSNNSDVLTQTYKIACIDDSVSMLDQIEQFFSQDNRYVLTKIADPIRAAALIFRLKPDLILMDITMPDINGYKLCHLLRSSDAFEKTPIIMVTGNKGLIDKARAKMVGATDYLTKPFTSEDLLGLAAKHLSSIQV